jgi:hypothetical protein
MSVIAIAIEPDSVTRIFFDCRADTITAGDEARIAKAIKDAATLARADAERLPQAA